ncbi:hypothetical protein HYX12_03620 [Candidatus Woesearchaeota archaeon]|nr:hypothetical protein [Candidatus Woesearchaeota archaeon]
MATVLDVGLLQYFEIIFPVILVFAVVFATLQKTKVIGEAVQINALIAIVAGLLMLLSQKAVKVINFVIPWFAIAIFFFLFLILLFKLFGMKDDTLVAAVKDKAVYWVLIGICLAIFGAGLSNVLGQEALEAGTGESGTAVTADGNTASGTYESNIWSIMSNPKILGVAIIFVIAVFMIALLTG